MKQIPIVVSSTLGNQPKSIASSSRTVGLLLPGNACPGNPRQTHLALNLEKKTIFVNFDGQNPTTSKEINVLGQLAFVRQTQSTVIQVTFELVEFGALDFLSITAAAFLASQCRP